MKITRLVSCAGVRGALFVATLAPVAGAQHQAWVRQLGTNGSDLAWGAAPDGSGGVFMSGYTSGGLAGPNAGGFDAFLARYDGQGTQLWARQFGTASPDYARAAASDRSGGVYVCGFTDAGPQAGHADAWVRRFDGAGNEAWLRHVGTINNNDYVEAAATDGAGGVYVSGFTGGSLGGPSAGHNDVWLARYDAAGNQAWLRQFGSSHQDFAYAATADGSGGVYLAGQTLGDLGGANAGGFDAWIARYDSAGNQTWLRQLGSTSHERANAMASDGTGGVYLGGDAEGSLGGSSAGGNDAWVARYDGAGNRLWIRQFGTVHYDGLSAGAPDGSGGLFVSGSTGGELGGPAAGSGDAWLARYDGAGHQTWIRQFGSDGGDNPSSAAPDGSGGVYLSGRTSGELGGPFAGGFTDAWLARYESLVATRYCAPAIHNSTGMPATLDVIGRNAAVANDITLVASQLPQGSFGYFLTSQVQDLVIGPGGSQGNLCLGASIGRFNGPGQVLNSGTSGWFSLQIDLNSIPQPLGGVTVQPGDTWNFQAWHRDANPNATTNFTDAVSVTFQ